MCPPFGQIGIHDEIEEWTRPVSKYTPNKSVLLRT